MTIYAPRAWLSFGGGAMIPCLKAEVCKTSKRAASTFSAELSITTTTLYGMDLASWADYQPVDVQIYMATQPGQGDLTSVALGLIDVPKIDLNTLQVSISGRDKTASLIETRRSQKFPNQSSSDIVSKIAQDNGLTPQVTSTSSFAGKQYNSNDAAHLVIHRTDFEILSDLADREGYRWYVNGPNLVFEPKGTASGSLSVFYAPPGTVAPYGVATVENLKVWRNMTAAKPHQVNVKSLHDKDMKQYTGSASAPGVGNQIVIDHHHSRKDQSQVDTLATSRAMDAIRHDCNISFDADLNLGVDAHMQVSLGGTGTIYDQSYDIDEVKFRVGWEDGGRMSVTAKAAKSGRTVSSGGSGDSGAADDAAGDSIST